jgi:predicted acyl esterase
VVTRSDAALGNTRLAAGFLTLAVALLAATHAVPADAQTPGAARTSVATFSARGSAEQVDVANAKPGERLVLVDRAGRRIGARRADYLGAALFRHVEPGPGYRVRQAGVGGRTRARSNALTVLSNRPTPPSTKLYRQPIPSSGYGYLTTRDGTKLAIDVHPPGPVSQGPYPTLIEYSGYGYADPAGGQNAIAAIGNLLGFTVVDVNIRGTGCSGGAFDFFEPLQSLDGYDVIETVARQPWALGHRVGMMGISYGGFSQLFVAATDPPSLSAIAPLSVIDSATTTLAPGGILNTGFTLTWAAQRDHDALPASAHGGQGWALARIRQGDRTCRANQALHAEAVSLVATIRDHPYAVPAIVDPRSPITFVHKIHVPVYLACQFTDEETGAHCPDLVEHFTGTSRKWFTFTNGLHVDSLDPATFTRWYDFLELFVAHRAPKLSAAVLGLGPTLFSAAMGVPGVNIPDNPIQAQSSYAGALAAFERLPELRIAFDNGAGSSTVGAPVAGFEQSFARFPVPGTQARSWYLAAGGGLTDTKPAAAAADAFTWNPRARPVTDFTGDTSSGPGGLWTAMPNYHWLPNPPGTAVSYVTAPLAADTTVVGAGAVQAWIRSSSSDVDLQVTVSEVRPDGKETFVQNGWLRAGDRKLDPRKSTLLEPVPSLLRRDAAPLPRGRWAEVTVPLFYEGHAYRIGSRIRVTIAAPDGDQPVWSFTNTRPRGTATVMVAHSAQMPSRLVLPVVPGVLVPTPLPPCPGLRGEPCRIYQPPANRAATP